MKDKKPFDTYFKALYQTYQSSSNEHAGRAPLENLLNQVKDKNITINHEETQKEGIPDFTIKKDDQIIGYLETKKPDVDCKEVAQSEQIRKYSSGVKNIIITNYRQFYWLSSGEQVSCCTFEQLTNPLKKLYPANVEKLGLMLEYFLKVEPERIGTAKELAEKLAKLCRLLTEGLKENLKNGSGRLHGIHQSFVKQISEALTKDDFADTFAQTLVFGLFMARLNAPPTEEITLENAKKHIPSLPLISELVSFLDEMEEDNYKNIAWVVKYIVATINNIELTEIEKSLRKQDERDPFIHFYEPFLASYNPKLRKARGVYYTPQPIVNFIVRGIDDLLKDKLNCQQGLAGSDVTMLDFACGTGTFLLETISQIFESNPSLKQKLLAEHILKNIHGFELLIAPYTIAHMKLLHFLKEQGVSLKDKQRLKIYLANTLEKIKHQPDYFLPALSDESDASNKIKDKDILVIMGNPPYKGESLNKGEWIKSKIEDYKYINRGKIKERNPKWLQNDYVKFIRFAQYKMESVPNGLVGIITSNSFLDGLITRGMRHSLMQTFNQIYILNLHGNIEKKETTPSGKKDENIFDIKEGVAISFFIKKKGLEKKVFYADFWGSRPEKYQQALNSSYKNIEWQELKPAHDSYFFMPFNYKSHKEYQKLSSIQNIFPKYSSGIRTANDKLSIRFTPEKIKQVVKEFHSLTPKEARGKFQLRADVRDWKVEWAQKDIKDNGQGDANFTSILYRPFDKRYTYYTGKTCGFICMPRQKLMGHMLNRDNLGLITVRQGNPSKNWDNVAITNNIIEGSPVSGKTGISYLFPLYLYEKTILKEKEKKENIDPKFRQWLAKKYQADFSPEQIMHYIYAILHCPSYRDKYAEFLQKDFPRIPFADNKDNFIELAELGQKLADYHLLKNIKPSNKICGKGDCKVSNLRYSPKEERIYINDSRYFHPVPKNVWDFYIGSYQVLDKYLKGRKDRELSLDEIDNVNKIIHALAETDNLMKEVDGIAKHFI